MSVIAQQTNQMVTYPTRVAKQKAKQEPIATKKQMLIMGALTTIILVTVHVANYHMFPMY